MNGLDVTLAALTADPYPVYAALRVSNPVAWVPELGMFLITRHADVRAVLLNDADFVVGTPSSLLFDTFGEHMLTCEGARHAHYRDAGTQLAFSASTVRARHATSIASRVRQLLDGVTSRNTADLRPAFAARLPILVMFDLFGLPDADEALFRSWYDSFEAALSNHMRDERVRNTAAMNVAAFHEHLQRRMDALRRAPGDARGSLLGDWLSRPPLARMSDEEIRRNALIVFFGGISTVEAMILNTLWLLLGHPQDLDRVRADVALAGPAVDEAIRLQAPVQSATRHCHRAVTIAGVRIPEGATVNCMVAAANRDPAVFPEPDHFDSTRTNQRMQLGFAVGPHHCLGRHLARAEAVAAVSAVVDRLPALRLREAVAPVGHEFRQPLRFPVAWD